LIPVAIRAFNNQKSDNSRRELAVALRKLLAEDARYSTSGGFLVQELRDSYPDLADEGWHQVAKLMIAAADEIARLQARLRELEAAKVGRS
jgi:hypothetical protein